MGTQATSVACNNCGAALEVGPSTRFVTCTYCSSQLEVHRTGAAAYTEVLHAIHQNTQQIAQDVQAIRQQNELEALDREWAIQREQFMTRNEDGSRSVPNATGSVVGAVVAALFGIIWIGFTSSMGGDSLFPLFGVLFIGVAIWAAIHGYRKAGAYAEAERNYQRRREEVMRRMQRD
jgi:hypothetical protein